MSDLFQLYRNYDHFTYTHQAYRMRVRLAIGNGPGVHDGTTAENWFFNLPAVAGNPLYIRTGGLTDGIYAGQRFDVKFKSVPAYYKIITDKRVFINQSTAQYVAVDWIIVVFKWPNGICRAVQCHKADIFD